MSIARINSINLRQVASFVAVPGTDLVIFIPLLGIRTQKKNREHRKVIPMLLCLVPSPGY